MAQLGVDPATGMLTLDGEVLDRYDPRLWGEMGQPVSAFGPGTQQSFRTRQSFDPQYFQETYAGQDEAGDQWTYSRRPEVAEMFGGRGQLLQAGHGGPGEFIDLSKLTYDPRYGVLTEAGNINPTEDSGFARWMNDGALMYMLGGGALAAIGAVGGLAGAAGGGGGAGVDAATGYGLGGSAGEAGAAGGMGGMGGAAGGVGGLATDIAPGYLAESAAPVVTETMAGAPAIGSPWYQGALNYATNNPVSTARGVAGLLGAATSGSGDSSGGGGSGGSGWSPSGPAPTFNPMGGSGGSQQPYQPLQFDPVPFMGDSQMFQNYSPYGSMPGQNPTMQSQGMGYNQASPVQLPWQQQTNGAFGPRGNQGINPSANQNYNGGAMPWQSSNPSFGKPYMQGGSTQGPSSGMGYIGSGPGGGFSPVQPPNGWGQPSQGASGGLLGNQGQRPDPYAQSSTPGMDNRTMQMMARYLPNSGTGVDPMSSRGSVEQAGGWQNFARQNYGPKVGGMFDQFMQANPGMNSYEDWRQRYPGM